MRRIIRGEMFRQVTPFNGARRRFIARTFRASAPGEGQPRWQVGELYHHPGMGIVTIREVSGNRVTLANGTTLTHPDIVPLFLPNSEVFTPEASRRIAAKADTNFYPACRIPLAFALDLIFRRSEVEKARGTGGYYTDLLKKDFGEILLVHPDAAVSTCLKRVIRDEGEAGDQIMELCRAVFPRILRETGEDVVIAAVLESFERGKDANGDEMWKRQKAWGLFGQDVRRKSPGANADTKGRIVMKLTGVSEDVDYYFRMIMLKNGIRLLNPEEHPILTDAQYAAERAKWNFSLAPYFPHGDSRHEGDRFSQLILRLKTDFGVAAQLFSMGRRKLEQLTLTHLADVDLVVPAPSQHALTNQTLPLADLVSRALGKELNLTGLRQERARSKQKAQRQLWWRAQNAGGIYGADSSEVAGKVILVVDDNETTGLTAAGMRAALYAAGAKKVYVLSFGKTANGGRTESRQDDSGPKPAEPYGCEEVYSLILRSALPMGKKHEVLEVLEQAEEATYAAERLLPALGAFLLAERWDESVNLVPRRIALQLAKRYADQLGKDVEAVRTHLVPLEEGISGYVRQFGYEKRYPPEWVANLQGCVSILGILARFRDSARELLTERLEISVVAKPTLHIASLQEAVEALGDLGVRGHHLLGTLAKLAKEAPPRFHGDWPPLAGAAFAAMQKIFSSCRAATVSCDTDKALHHLRAMKEERNRQIPEELLGDLDSTIALLTDRSTS